MTAGSQIKPYSALASVYDEVMQHVDYRAWAIYLAEIIDEFRPGATTLLEMGCGTGSLAFELAELNGATYSGFDRSADMIAVAQQKNNGQSLRFYVDDFLSFSCNERVDVAFLLYDGLNYLLEQEDVRALFENVRECLAEDSIFIFDVSTPANSLKNVEYFEDSGKGDDFSYYRTSEYDPETRLHRTLFQLELDGKSFTEEHVQRAYHADEIMDTIRSAGLTCLATMEDFTWHEPTEESERIHFVVGRLPSSTDKISQA